MKTGKKTENREKIITRARAGLDDIIGRRWNAVSVDVFELILAAFPAARLSFAVFPALKTRTFAHSYSYFESIKRHYVELDRT